MTTETFLPAATAPHSPTQTVSSPAPVWASSALRRDEPVFFLRPTPTSSPEGRLVLAPRRLLRARRADGQQDFPIEDFRLEQHRLVYVGSSPLPCLLADELFPAVETDTSIARHRDGIRYLLFGRGGPLFHRHQVCFDYETDEDWGAPLPESQAASLPRLHQRIGARDSDPLVVALLGDSISAGCDASAFLDVYPHQPAYGALFAQHLCAAAQRPVVLHNFSVGGMDSAWGLTQTAAVSALRPDLVIVAFGMNDASGRLPAAQLSAHVAAIVRHIASDAPAAEFVLVAGMDANPAWSLASLDLKPAYRDALRALARPHVAFCDVKPSWDYLVARKDYPSLTGNGVNHPNDFGHRLYADLLARAVLGPVDSAA